MYSDVNDHYQAGFPAADLTFMIVPKQLLALLLMLTFFSCNNSTKYPYAIKDFREKLQPFLIKMVTKGIVTERDSVFQHLVTDAELLRLVKSEHPILRATALREIFDRKSMNHFEVLMRHLDDTALVFIDDGEFGIGDRNVSDEMLLKASWKTQAEKDKTVEQVLTRHNYLTAAYRILEYLPPQEKYYPFIKDMATRPRRLDPYYGTELGFRDIESALYGLAKFRKKEDVAIINQKLTQHIGRISETSFILLKEYPDPAYFEVLNTYHRRQFYRFSGNRPHGFTGFKADRAAPEDFIQAVAAQQNTMSANLLDSMLYYLPLQKKMPDKKNIINAVIMAIWEHPCPAYLTLRGKIKEKAEAILKWKGEGIPYDFPVDTTKREIRWYP